MKGIASPLVVGPHEKKGLWNSSLAVHEGKDLLFLHLKNSVADEFAAEDPEIVDMRLNALFRQTGSGEVDQKRREAFDDVLPGQQIAYVAHPTLGPLRQVPTVGQ